MIDIPAPFLPYIDILRELAAVLLIAVWFAQACASLERRTVEERRIPQVVHWSELP